jgi:hypothetical protein
MKSCSYQRTHGHLKYIRPLITIPAIDLKIMVIRNVRKAVLLESYINLSRPSSKKISPFLKHISAAIKCTTVFHQKYSLAFFLNYSIIFSN